MFSFQHKITIIFFSKTEMDTDCQLIDEEDENEGRKIVDDSDDSSNYSSSDDTDDDSSESLDEDAHDH